MDLNTIMTDMLKKKAIETISQKTWMDAKASQDLAAKAMPVLLAALKKNASDPKKAESLEKAVAKNDGSVLEDTSKVDLRDGSKILGHIFGDKQKDVEKTVGSADGLAALAPLVMAALGKANSQSGESANSLLSSDMVMNVASSFLDKDGDGDIKDDLLTMWMNFLKKKFSGK